MKEIGRPEWKSATTLLTGTSECIALHADRIFADIFIITVDGRCK